MATELTDYVRVYDDVVSKDVCQSILTAIQFSDSEYIDCLLYTSPSPRDRQKSRMPSSA